MKAYHLWAFYGQKYNTRENTYKIVVAIVKIT
jgi:hypothetical protein